MSKITLPEIREELAKYKWTCDDNVYVNLKTPMHFRCDEGHIVESTWDKIRRKPICPVCAANVKKQVKPMQIIPKTDAYRILALDQATYKTGYSIYDGTDLIAHGVYETYAMTALERIVKVCDWLDSMLVNWKPDEVGLEETQYQPGNGTGHDVFKLLSQLMGAIMLSTARRKCKVNTVLIPTWRHHCGVKGRVREEQKASAQALVKTWYDISVTDDESDAICIGKYFADTHEKSKPTIGEFN